MENKDPLGILKASDEKKSDPLGILNSGEKKNSVSQSTSKSPSVNTTSSLTNGESEQVLPKINESLNPPGVLNPTNLLVAPEPLLPPIRTTLNSGLERSDGNFITDKEAKENKDLLTQKGYAKMQADQDKTLLGSSEMFKSGLSGFASAGAMLARSPAYLSDLTNKTINTVVPLNLSNLPADAAKQPNSIAESLEATAKGLDESANKEHPLPAYDYFKNGEYSKGFSKVANNFAQMLPISAAIIGASAAGVPEAAGTFITAVPFAAGEKQNLLEKNKAIEEQNKQLDAAGTPELKQPLMTDEQINDVSAISGWLEGATEFTFGQVKLGQIYKSMIEKEGKEVADKVVGEGVKKILAKGFGRYFGEVVGGEMAGEGTNQLLSNYFHMENGDKSVKSIWEGVMDAATTAAFSAGTLGSGMIPHTIISAHQAAIAPSHAAEANKHLDNQNTAKEILSNPNSSPEERDAATNALDRSFKEEDKLTTDVLKKNSLIPENKKWEIGKHLADESVIYKAIEAVNKNTVYTEEERKKKLQDYKDEIAAHQKAIDDIYKENDKLVEGHEKATIDKDAVSDEHENLFKEFNSSLTEKLKAEKTEKDAKEKLKAEKESEAKKKRISEIESLLSSDNASLQETGSGNLISEARNELKEELKSLQPEKTTAEKAEKDAKEKLKAEKEIKSIEVKPPVTEKTTDKEGNTTIELKLPTIEVRHSEDHETKEGIVSGTSDPSLTKEGKEKVEHVIVAHAPTQETLDKITSSVDNEPLVKNGEKIAEKIGEDAKKEGVENIVTDNETERTKETAKIAGGVSGAKVKEVEGLHTWHKGDFDQMESKEWKESEKYFIDTPDAKEHNGKKLKESFNEFKDRYLSAKEKALKETKGKTMFVGSSTGIRLEQALEHSKGEWNEQAKEHFLNNSVEHKGEIQPNPKTETNENAREKNTGSNKEGANGNDAKSPIEKKRYKVGRKKRAKEKIRDPRFLQALSHETTSPYHKVLQYFIGGGRINKSSMQDLYGNASDDLTKRNPKVEKEYNKRFQLMSEKSFGIKKLAEHLASEGGDERYDDTHYREAIEDVLNSFNSKAKMAEAINKEFQDKNFKVGKEEEEYHKWLNQEAVDKVGEEPIDEGIIALEGLTDEEAEKFFKNKDLLEAWLDKQQGVTDSLEENVADEIENEEAFNLPVRSSEEIDADIERKKAELEGAEKPTGATTKEAIKEEATEEADKGFNDKEILAKLEKDYIALKYVKNVEKKLGDVLIKLKEYVAEGKITDKKAAQQRKRFLDNVAARKNTEATIKRVLQRVADWINQNQNNGIIKNTIVPGMNKVVDRFCASIAEAIIEAQRLGKVGVAAIDYVLAHAKESKIYKELVRLGDIDDKTFATDFKKQYNEQTNKVEAEKVKEEKAKAVEDNKRQQTDKKQEKPKERKSRKSVKSVSTNLYESEHLADKAKEAIKKNGLDRDVYTHAEANAKARELINEVGIEGALQVAKDKNSDIAGNVRTFILSHIINDLHAAEVAAKTPEQKDRLADKQADVMMSIEDLTIEMEKQSTQAGRLIGAIGEFYKASPLGIKKKLIKDIEKLNSAKKKKMPEAMQAFKELSEALNKLDKEHEIETPKKATVATKSKTELKEIRERRKELFGKLRDSFNNKKGDVIKMSAAPVTDEQLGILFDIAKTYVESGVVKLKDLVSELNKGLKKETGYKLTDKDVDYLLNQEVDGKKLGDIVTEKPEYDKVKREKQLKAIEKALEKKDKKKPRAQVLKEHEKLLDLYEQGATNTNFENAFFEKFGLTDVNRPEVKEKLDEFSKKIHAAPEGVLKDNEKVKYLNWLTDYRTSNRIESGMSAWYASILSSYETHLRNMQFNGWSTLVTQPTLLAQKAIMKGNVKEALKYYTDVFGSFGQGFREGWHIIKTGEKSGFENHTIDAAIERSPVLKFLRLPGRALRAADVMATRMLYNAKLRDVFGRVVDVESEKAGKKLTTEERNKAIDDLLGNAPERIEYAEKTANSDIEKIYGENWKENKLAVRAHEIRTMEIVDQSRPLVSREDARGWAKKSLLTNKPEGVLGVISDIANTMLSELPATRPIIPFVNVPLNLVNQSIERSPLGFIKPLRGTTRWKKDNQYHRELTQDEKKELYLKATNYSIALGAVILAVGMSKSKDDDDDKSTFIVTGEEGGYFKNQNAQKGGGLEPYTVYLGGKNGLHFNYKSTPFDPILSFVGFMRDYQKFEKTADGTKDLMDKLVFSTEHFMTNVVSQTSMKGLKGILKYADPEEWKRMGDESLGKSIAKELQTAIPYSGLIKATTKDVKGASEMEEKTGHDFIDYLVNGLPIDYYQDAKIDILGRPIKSQFEIPLVPYEKKNFSNDGQPVDRYYKLFYDKDYDMSTKFIKTKNAYTDKKGDFILSKKELYDLNKTKGEFTQRLLDQQHPKGSLFNQMQHMSNGEFAEVMDNVMAKSTELAKIKTFIFNGNMPDKQTLEAIDKKYDDMLKKDKAAGETMNVFTGKKKKYHASH